MREKIKRLFIFASKSIYPTTIDSMNLANSTTNSTYCCSPLHFLWKWQNNQRKVRLVHYHSGYLKNIRNTLCCMVKRTVKISCSPLCGWIPTHLYLHLNSHSTKDRGLFRPQAMEIVCIIERFGEWNKIGCTWYTDQLDIQSPTVQEVFSGQRNSKL